MKRLVSLVLVLVLANLALIVLGDVYLHNPRGCNNRLNENSQNRDNNNRIMDTQNNAKGGYCWGPPLYYYVGSILPIEWTAQHSCGNANAHCEMIIQYMCGDPLVRDGTTTDTIPDEENAENQKVSPDPLTGENKEVFKYGLHENYDFYQACKTRSRNRGLYIADNNLGNKAINTRQNPNGGRSGYECPEDRDYYPYWHPTPWKDIAVLTNHPERCEYYKAESQNVKEKNFCNDTQYNNEFDCVKNGGGWVTRKALGIAPPDCVKTDWSRDNHLGNGITGYPITYNWTIPNDVDKACVLRVRYNISTGDYDNWAFNASHNFPNTPLREDPSVGVMGRNLTLAINTRQTGRTFQDRSYVFEIRKRPDDIPKDATIHNLNVRGKRGNIVQVYPAVEYDFVPNVLHTEEGDYVHFQWTGCDTNPQNNDGEGTRGTDRSNIVQLRDLADNYPDYTPEDPMIVDEKKRFRFAHIGQNDTQCDSLTELLQRNNNNEDEAERDVKNCAKLNAAPRYFDGGLVQMKKEGTYHYMSSRNNNFSNRSQKGTIIVGDPDSKKSKAGGGQDDSGGLSGASIAAIVIGSLLGAVLLVLLGSFFLSNKAAKPGRI